MGNDILVVADYYNSPEVVSKTWWEDLGYLPEYKTIVLDTTSILRSWKLNGRVEPLERRQQGDFSPADRPTSLPQMDQYILTDVDQQDMMLKSNMHKIRQNLVEMAEFDSFKVYVLFSPNAEILVESKKPQEEFSRFLGTNDWCPISIATVSEGGQKIHLVDDSYRGYFRAFGEWKYRFVPESVAGDELQGYYGDEWHVEVSVEPIATNNLGKPIAAALLPAFHELSYDYDEQEYVWGSAPRKHGIALAFLPMGDEYHAEQAIDFLVSRAYPTTESPPPSWATAITVPGQSQVLASVAELEREIAYANEKRDTLLLQNDSLERWKWLLHETGKGRLELVVRDALSLFGMSAEPQPDKDSDGKLTSEFGVGLLEVEGAKETVKVEKVSQLIRNIGNFLNSSGQVAKGVLVGNPFRDYPPEDRPPKGSQKQLFSKELLEAAQKQNVAVLLSSDLFSLVCSVLSGQLTDQGKKSVRQKIWEGRGLVRLP